MNKILPAEEIAELTDDKEGLANRRAINKLYREQDESHLYPVLNKFNVTERAIRKVSKLERANGAIGGYEYCVVLEWYMSEIVNNPNL